MVTDCGRVRDRLSVLRNREVWLLWGGLLGTELGGPRRKGCLGRKGLSRGAEASAYGADGGASLEKPPKEHRSSNLRGFPRGPVIRTRLDTFTAKSAGSAPGRGTKSLQVTWCGPPN